MASNAEVALARSFQITEQLSEKFGGSMCVWLKGDVCALGMCLPLLSFCASISPLLALASVLGVESLNSFP